MLLDTTKLVELRHSRGLSQRAVARALGVSSPTVTRLEAGIGHEQVTLERLRRLAQALATTPRQLLATESGDSPAAEADDVIVEAALTRSKTMIQTDELADGLAWTLRRTTLALRALEARLRGTGVTVRRTTNGWAIYAREDALTQTQLLELERARQGRRGLTISHARLLLRVLQDEIDARWEQHASNADRVTLASLLKAGYVRKDNSRYELTPPIAAALAPLPETPDEIAAQRRRPAADTPERQAA